MAITPTRLTAERAAIEYTKRHARKYTIALLGDGAGNVDVAGRDNWVWVRLEADDTQLTQAKVKSAIDRVENLAVMVERVLTNGATNYQVIGLAPVPDYPNSGYDGAVADHAENHEIRDFGAGGKDKLNVYTRSHVELRARAQTTPDMTVYVEHGKYAMNGAEVFWTGGDSPAFTAPSAGYKRFDLLYFDDAGDLQIESGTPALASLFTTPSYPSAPSGAYFPLAYVLLTGGQTTITETSIADARIAWGALGDGAMVAHDILGGYHTVTGAAGKLVGLTALNTLGLVDPYTLPTPGTLTVSTTNSASGAHTHAITSSSNVSAGTSAILASSSGALTLKFLTTPNNTSDSGIKVGNLELQSYSINNSFINENCYFNGSSWRYRADGYAAMFYFYTGEGQFRVFDTGLAGAALPSAGNVTQLKINNSGKVGIGGLMPVAVGSFTSSTLFVDNNGTVGIGTQSPTARLSVSYGGSSFSAMIDMYDSAADGIPYLAIGKAASSSNAIVWGWDSANQVGGFWVWGDTLDTGLAIKKTGLVGIGTQAPVTKLHIITNNATTNATDNIVTIAHNSTGTPAALFGAGLLWTLESSTTADQNAALDSVLWTDATHASRTALRRSSVVGNATNTGYYGFWNHNAVVGSALTVIPNATGDVTSNITVLYSVKPSTGTASGGVVNIPLNADSIIWSDDAGANTLTLTVAADGSVTIARSAGAYTYGVALSMVWI